MTIPLNASLAPNGAFPLARQVNVSDGVFVWQSGMDWSVVRSFLDANGGTGVVIVMAQFAEVTTSYDFSNVLFIGASYYPYLQIDAGVSLRNAGGFVRLNTSGVGLVFMGQHSNPGDLIQLYLANNAYSFACYGTDPTGPAFPQVADGSYVYIESQGGPPGDSGIYVADGTKNAIASIAPGNTLTLYARGEMFISTSAGYAFTGMGTLHVNHEMSDSTVNPNILSGSPIDPNLTLILNEPYPYITPVGTPGTVGGSGLFLNSITTNAQGQVTSATSSSVPGTFAPTDPRFDPVLYAKGINVAGSTNDETNGMMFFIAQPGTQILGARWWHPAGATQSVKLSLWSEDVDNAAVTLLASKTVTPVAHSIMSVQFDTPVTLTHTRYRYSLGIYDGVHGLLNAQSTGIDGTMIPLGYNENNSPISQGLNFSGHGTAGGDSNIGSNTNYYIGMYPLYSLP